MDKSKIKGNYLSFVYAATVTNTQKENIVSSRNKYT